MTALMSNFHIHPANAAARVVDCSTSLKKWPVPPLPADPVTTTPVTPVNRNSSNNNHNNRRSLPFPMPKKLGSDRLLLVSNALHEIPTYKSISPELERQRKSLRKIVDDSKQQQQQQQRRRRVHFRCIDDTREFHKDYDASDYPNLFFSSAEFAAIFERDDRDYAVCYNEMAHTKQILQLWGACSRRDNDDKIRQGITALLLLQQQQQEQQQQQAPIIIDNARGLEQRIITGIRNHRQKAVQSFLQYYRDESARQLEDGSSSSYHSVVSLSASSSSLSDEHDSDNDHELATTVCPRYLKFSQTAARFARALALGDALVAQQIQAEQQQEEQPQGDHDDDDDDEWRR